MCILYILFPFVQCSGYLFVYNLLFFFTCITRGHCTHHAWTITNTKLLFLFDSLELFLTFSESNEKHFVFNQLLKKRTILNSTVCFFYVFITQDEFMLIFKMYKSCSFLRCRYVLVAYLVKNCP